MLTNTYRTILCSRGNREHACLVLYLSGHVSQLPKDSCLSAHFSPTEVTPLKIPLQINMLFSVSSYKPCSNLPGHPVCTFRLRVSSHLWECFRSVSGFQLPSLFSALFLVVKVMLNRSLAMICWFLLLNLRLY